jgi:hypothetical protein
MLIPSRKRLSLERLEDRLAPAVINVVSTADNSNPVVTAGHAGTAADPFLAPSLRSALSFVNSATDGSNNVINLTVAGAYKITLAGTAGETDNAAGEFSILPSGTNGSSLTIQNTSGGTAPVDANHLNRVFDINPNNLATSPKFSVTMIGFTITGGDAFDAANPDGATSSGGAIRDQNNVSLTLTNMVLTGNVASADGGGVSMENAPASTPWTLTLNNTVISDNHAGDAGGGVETDGTGTVVITGGQLLDNTCLNQGAAVWLDAIAAGSASLSMTNVLVTGNAAQNGPTGAIGNAGSGAVTITDCTVENNSSGTTGGGFGDENNLGTLTVTRSVFLDNSAAGSGGAIEEGGPSTTITSSSIQDNSGGLGGGLFVAGTTLTMTNCTIAGNTAGVGPGGLEVQTSGTGASASTITSTTITGNSALNNSGANGGGIEAPAAFTGTLTLLDDTINGNYATSGGGIFWDGTTGTIALENTLVAGNFAGTGPDANNPAGTFTDMGGNLIGVSGAGSGNTGFTASNTLTGTVAAPLDPKLGPLQNNGSPTIGGPVPTTLLTEVPLPGSPAIGKGIRAGPGQPVPYTDERGYLFATNAAGKPTIGAVEVLTPQERFVQALYYDEFGGRVGDKEELDGWVQVLNAAGQQAVASGIVNSFEARFHVARGWYLTYLGRSPSGIEASGWANLLGIQSEEQVLSEFLSSDEFFNRAQTLGFGGTPSQNYVQALYDLLLGRTGSAAEVAGWVNALSALGRAGVVLGFLQSGEYRTITVTGYYHDLLHRLPSAAEVAAWVFSALDTRTIRVSFEASPEFFSNG